MQQRRRCLLCFGGTLSCQLIYQLWCGHMIGDHMTGPNYVVSLASPCYCHPPSLSFRLHKLPSSPTHKSPSSSLQQLPFYTILQNTLRLKSSDHPSKPYQSPSLNPPSASLYFIFLSTPQFTLSPLLNYPSRIQFTHANWQKLMAVK